ncbi:hypothetical protein VNO77_46940 [Canavalia gladiata]|uniref:Uncharacterized protein n=1 Tax=Canavalia gladiata TaxID=3824 RepID=A0AAN9JJI4_CANGL
MSDAKPRTSLRSYWHTLPKKKEQTPLKTRVRYNKAISVHRPSHGAVRGRYRSYSSQPASNSENSTVDQDEYVLDSFSSWSFCSPPGIDRELRRASSCWERNESFALGKRFAVAKLTASLSPRAKLRPRLLVASGRLIPSPEIQVSTGKDLLIPRGRAGLEASYLSPISPPFLLRDLDHLLSGDKERPHSRRRYKHRLQEWHT